MRVTCSRRSAPATAPPPHDPVVDLIRRWISPPTVVGGSAHRTADCEGLVAQPARRTGALPLLRARRSSSDDPPQAPASWPESIAHVRQVWATSQRRQTALA